MARELCSNSTKLISFLDFREIAGLVLLGFLFIKRSRKNNKPEKEEESQTETYSAPQLQPSSSDGTVDFDSYKPIGKETVILLLKKLEDFENQKGFTKRGLKLYDLAVELGTNDNYLSRVISVSKGKNFNQYVNDFRLDYFVELRNSSPDEENIKSLARQSGFDDYSIFYRTYKERYSINPAAEN